MVSLFAIVIGVKLDKGRILSAVVLIIQHQKSFLTRPVPICTICDVIGHGITMLIKLWMDLRRTPGHQAVKIRGFILLKLKSEDKFLVELNLKVAKSVTFATFRELLIKNVSYEKKMSPPLKRHVQLFPNLNHFTKD